MTLLSYRFLSVEQRERERKMRLLLSVNYCPRPAVHINPRLAYCFPDQEKIYVPRSLSLSLSLSHIPARKLAEEAKPVAKRTRFAAIPIKEQRMTLCVTERMCARDFCCCLWLFKARKQSTAAATQANARARAHDLQCTSRQYINHSQK